MSRQLFNQTPLSNSPHPIGVGGSASSDAIAAREALHLVGEVQSGEANGVVPLNSESKVPVQYLPGLQVASGDTVQLLLPNMQLHTSETTNILAMISNYDIQRTYEITVDHGVVSLITQAYADANPNINDIQSLVGSITYTALSTPGVDILTINGRTFDITVLQSSIDKPHITSPQPNTIISNNQFSLNISPLNQIGYQDTSVNLEYMISSVNDFTSTVVHETVSSSQNVNLISNLTPGDYYIRARYVGGTYTSSWSDISLITIYTVPYPQNESQVIFGYNVDSNYAYRFGRRLDVNETGDSLITGAPEMDQGSSNNIGVVHVFKKLTVGGNYSLQKTITQPFGNLYDVNGFGAEVRFADNGNLAFIYCSKKQTTNITPVSTSSLCVYKTTTQDDLSTLSFLTSMDFDPGTEQDNYDYSSMSVSLSGDTIALFSSSFYINNPPGTQDQYYVKILKFENSTLSLVTQLTSDTNHDWNVARIDLNDNGSRLVLGTRWGDIVSGHGAAYVYDFDGVNWIQTSILFVPATAAALGLSVAMSGNGNTIAVGDYTYHTNRPLYGDNVDGVVYTYELINSHWELSQILVPTLSNYRTQYRPDDLALSHDGSLLFVGSGWSETPQVLNGYSAGLIDVYRKPTYGSNMWVFTTTLLGSVVTNNRNRYLGDRISISKTGKILAGGAWIDESQSGSVHLFI